MTLPPTHADATGSSADGERSIAPGTWIGPYQVVSELGRGGMGVVLRVQDQTGREAALKLILNARADETALARFGREAEVLARIRHRNVIRVFELGRATQGPYLVTEFLEGEALNERLKRGALEPDEAVRVVIALCDAVQAVHDAGILHRDLKPHNVILCPDGTPVLLDFGIAQDESAEKLTQTGQLLGTPSYMAPEQASGDRSAIDARSDVYGLGAILFALLNGESPFHAAKAGGQFGLIRAVLDGDPEWPREEELPAELVALGRHLLAPTRLERPQSAREAGALLRQYLVQGDRARARRPLWLVIGVALAVLLLAGGAFGAYLRWGRVAPRSVEGQGSARPADFDLRVAKLGSFADEGFLAALEALAADPAYGDHLDRLRAGGRAFRQLRTRIQSAVSEQVVSAELVADLRAFLRDWSERPEAAELRDALPILAAAAPPSETHVVASQTGPDLAGVCLDPAGERVLALAYRRRPYVDWMRGREGKAVLGLHDEVAQPLVLVHLREGAEALIPVPKPRREQPKERVAIPFSPTSYVAAGDGRVWLALEQTLAIGEPGAQPARLQLWDLAKRELVRELRVPGIPAQDDPDLARGVGQVSALARLGDRLAVGMGDGRILVLDASSGEPLWQQHEHRQQVIELGFASDGRLLSIGGHDLADWTKTLGDAREDMRVLLWSKEGKVLGSYSEALGGRGGRIPRPTFVAIWGRRGAVGTMRNHVVSVLDLDAPDGEEGEKHHFLRGGKIEATEENSLLPAIKGRWSPSGVAAVGALWLSPGRILVWGVIGRQSELRVFDVPTGNAREGSSPDDERGQPRERLAWGREDRLQHVWLSPDGAHLLLSSKANRDAKDEQSGAGGAATPAPGRPALHLLERRRLAP